MSKSHFGTIAKNLDLNSKPALCQNSNYSNSTYCWIQNLHQYINHQSLGYGLIALRKTQAGSFVTLDGHLCLRSISLGTTSNFLLLIDSKSLGLKHVPPYKARCLHSATFEAIIGQYCLRSFY